MTRLLSILAAVTSAYDTIDIKPQDDIFFNGKESYGGLQSVHPGLKIRISQGLTDVLQQNLVAYGMTYINLYFNLADQNGQIQINFWPMRLILDVKHA